MPATGSGGLGQSRYQMQRASAAGSDGSSTVPATGSSRRHIGTRSCRFG
jgi:hypothetical protein